MRFPRCVRAAGALALLTFGAPSAYAQTDRFQIIVGGQGLPGPFLLDRTTGQTWGLAISPHYQWVPIFFQLDMQPPNNRFGPLPPQAQPSRQR